MEYVLNRDRRIGVLIAKRATNDYTFHKGLELLDDTQHKAENAGLLALASNTAWCHVLVDAERGDYKDALRRLEADEGTIARAPISTQIHSLAVKGALGKLCGRSKDEFMIYSKEGLDGYVKHGLSLPRAVNPSLGLFDPRPHLPAAILRSYNWLPDYVDLPTVRLVQVAKEVAAMAR